MHETSVLLVSSRLRTRCWASTPVTETSTELCVLAVLREESHAFSKYCLGVNAQWDVDAACRYEDGCVIPVVVFLGIGQRAISACIAGVWAIPGVPAQETSDLHSDASRFARRGDGDCVRCCCLPGCLSSPPPGARVRVAPATPPGDARAQLHEGAGGQWPPGEGKGVLSAAEDEEQGTAPRVQRLGPDDA